VSLLTFPWAPLLVALCLALGLVGLWISRGEPTRAGRWGWAGGGWASLLGAGVLAWGLAREAGFDPPGLGGASLAGVQRSAPLDRLRRTPLAGELRVTLWNVPAEDLQRARLDRTLADLWLELALVGDARSLPAARPRHAATGLRLGPVIEFQEEQGEQPARGTYGESLVGRGPLPRERILAGVLGAVGPRFDWGLGPQRARLRLDFGPDPSGARDAETFEIAASGEGWVALP
jgi:hypothetical protein